MKTLTRIEACQVLLDGGKLEYSQIDLHYWSDLNNRDLIFTLNDKYIFRETPKYNYVEYTLDDLAKFLKTFGHKEVWMFNGDHYIRSSVISLDIDKIASRAFRGEKFYKRVEVEEHLELTSTQLIG